ncbi:hypothetical protein GALMADRAFT_277404 [Galerina marginata CBS 339.88]|uniref:FAD/NAD(P)-binding domain-containing protein n=1 Tax=Galerina marginata (strain CBS 339.88) TaxID=685588 RepID=A0A067TA95_GALM3|nr:hypothetical protein GALMADRAFT_277404 [Galerina marginata CBS 339.88]
MTANDSQRVQRIGIIGVGPAGLAALKTVLDTPQYKAGVWIPTAFEARPNVGGVWLPSAPVTTLDGLPVTPPTPLYDSLTTNLPHPIMAFSSLSFPPSTPLFPKAQVVQTYLESYAEVFKLWEYILFNHRVVNADWTVEGYWVVHTQAEHEGKLMDQNGKEDRNEWHFDLLLVCNGHHNVPRYPQIPGLSTWLAAGRAAHSMFYRNPSSVPVPPSPSVPSNGTEHYPHLKKQTVLVIGGGPSGSDITSELVPVAARVLHSFSPNSAAARQAARGAGTDADTNILDAPSPVPPGIADSAIIKPRVSRFSPSPHGGDEGGIVYFEDGSEERGVDFCVVATGYEVYFPFFGSTSTSGSLSSLQKPSQSSNLLDHTPHSNGIPNPDFIIHNALVPSNPSLSRIDSQLRNTSWSVFPLARHLFGLPGCGFASVTNAVSNSRVLTESTSHPFQTSSGSSPTPASTSAQAPNLHSTLADATSTSPALPPPTSLAFLGLLVRVVPLPLVEAQARAALDAWAAGSTDSTSLDWDHEKEEVLGRWEDLKVKWQASRSASVSGVRGKGREKEDELQMRTFISREFQRFAEEMKQFDYRDALDDLADALSSETKDGTGLHDRTPRVKPWERHFYAEKNKLRQAWVELERRGVAEEWVRGVGEGKDAEAEWVVFMERVLDFGRTL